VYCKYLQTQYSFLFSTRQPTNSVWNSLLLCCDWTKAFWLFTTLNSFHRETVTKRAYKSLQKLKETTVRLEGFAFAVQHLDYPVSVDNPQTRCGASVNLIWWPPIFLFNCFTRLIAINFNSEILENNSKKYFALPSESRPFTPTDKISLRWFLFDFHISDTQHSERFVSATHKQGVDFRLT